MKKKIYYPYCDIKSRKQLNRDYCFLISGEKYNRNPACKIHDNAYGINGGGNSGDRKRADKRFYISLKRNKDPMALWVYIAVRLFGWCFFNYKESGIRSGILWKKLLLRNQRK